MIAHKFRGRLDRAAIITEMTAAVATARAGGAQTIGVNAEDGSRTDDGFLLEFALAAKDAGADRIRYCDTIGGDSPERIRERFAKLAAAIGVPVERTAITTWAWPWLTRSPGRWAIWTRAGRVGQHLLNGIGERAGNADLVRCILAFRHGFGVAGRARSATRSIFPGRGGSRCGPATRSASRCRRASRARPQRVRTRVGIHADGALKDRHNYELYDDDTLGPFPHDWGTRHQDGSC